MNLTEQTIAAGGHDWFYREITPDVPNGKPPVLFIHGILCHSYGWRILMETCAAAGYRAIAPDWLGFGRSAKPQPREFAYSPAAYEAALGDWITAMELEQFTLVAQGYLGSVGVQYACNHPEQIDRLVILNAPLTTSATVPWIMQRWTIPFVGDMLTQDPLLVDRTLEGGSGLVIEENELSFYRQPFLKSSQAGRALLMTAKKLNLSQAMGQLSQDLAQWRKPTQIIWGMADPWLDGEPVRQQLQKNPMVDWNAIAEAKHYPQEHWGQEIGQILLPFLNREFSELGGS
jgi:haloalkane dehalogenase